MGLRTLLTALQASDRVSADSITGPFQVSSGDQDAPVVCFQFRMSHFTCKAYLAHGAQEEGSQHLKLQTTFEDNRRFCEEQRYFVANEWNATKRYTRLKCGSGGGAGRSSVFTLEYDVLVPGDTPHTWGLLLIAQTLRMWYTSMVACVMHIVEPRDLPFATHEMITANTLAMAVGEADLALQREACPICFETFQVGEKVRRLPCMHIFHVVGGDMDSSQGRHCNIDRHLICDKQCPVCKTPIDVMERMGRTGGSAKVGGGSSSGQELPAPSASANATDGPPALNSSGVRLLTSAPIATGIGVDLVITQDRGDLVITQDTMQRTTTAASIAAGLQEPPVGGNGTVVTDVVTAPTAGAANATGAATMVSTAPETSTTQSGDDTATGEVAMAQPTPSTDSANEPVAAATAAVAAATALVASAPVGDVRALGAAAAAGLPAQAVELQRAVRSLQSRWLQIQDVVAGMQQMLQYIEESQSVVATTRASTGPNGDGDAVAIATIVPNTSAAAPDQNRDSQPAAETAREEGASGDSSTVRDPSAASAPAVDTGARADSGSAAPVDGDSARDAAGATSDDRGTNSGFVNIVGLATASEATSNSPGEDVAAGPTATQVETDAMPTDRMAEDATEVVAPPAPSALPPPSAPPRIEQHFTEAEKLCMAYIWRQRRAAAMRPSGSPSQP